MKRILLGSPFALSALFLGAGTAVLAAAPAPQTTPASSSLLAAPSEDERVVSALIELAARDNRVQDHLHHLCTAIGPRLTASHNLQKAQQWSLEQFRSWGLDANLEAWGDYPVGFDRGPWRGGIVGADPVTFDFATMAWSAGTQGPVRGRALLKPETEEELAEVQEHLPGAWLLQRTYARSADRPSVAKEVRERIDAAIEAAGIAGEIRSTGRDLVHTGGNHRIAWDKLPTRPSVRLRGDHATLLRERIEAGEPVEVEFDIDNRFFEGPVPQYNVIADIKGSERPDEFVMVGGHLDSWDGAQGAVDNGTGSATTLEAARLLMAVGAKPKRTIRFALWSGEEQGLYGSKGYVRDHADELERISAIYIHDGGTNYLSGLSATYDMEAQMRKVCAPLFGLSDEMPFRLQVTEGMQFRPDSDHAPFCSAGVPGFFWQQAGKSDYNHMHHTQYDTFDTAVPEYQRHSALVAALAAYNTANLPELLNRDNFLQVEPRRMGVQLEGTTLATVNEGGMAQEAGWQKGDVVVSIDGVAIKTRDEVTEELQRGGPRKTFVLRRGDATVESVLDYTNTKGEAERAKRAALRDARREAERKKFW